MSVKATAFVLGRPRGGANGQQQSALQRSCPVDSCDIEDVMQHAVPWQCNNVVCLSIPYTDHFLSGVAVGVSCSVVSTARRYRDRSRS